MDSTESTLLQAAAFEPHGLTGGAPATRHLGFAAWLVSKTTPSTLVGLGSEEQAFFDGLRQVLQHTGQHVQIKTFDLGKGGDSEWVAGSIQLMCLDARCNTELLQTQWPHWVSRLAPNALLLCLNTDAVAPDSAFARFWQTLATAHPVRLDGQTSRGLGLLQLGCSEDLVGDIAPSDWAVVGAGFGAWARAREAEFDLAPLRLQAKVLMQALAERDVALAERDKAALGYRHELMLRDESFKLLHDSLHGEIDRLVREIGDNGRQYEQELNAVRRSYEDSASWRLTKPLRSLLMRLRQWRQGRAAPPAPTPAAAPAPASPPQPTSALEVPNRFDYQAWIERYDTPDAAQLTEARARLRTMAPAPRVSLVMSMSTAAPTWLQRSLASLREQVHSDWELLLIGTAFDPQAMAELARDPRIRWVEVAGTDSAGLNQAMAQASGEWLLFLHSGDTLSPMALLWLIEAAARQPDARLIYGDEDRLDEHGQRCQPRFKCDANPELLLACDLFDGMTAYRLDLLRELGGLHAGYGAARFHDLHLRASEVLAPEQIQHLPRLLRHAAQAEVRNGPASLRAVSEHLQRRGVAAVVEEAPEAPGLVRVRYALPVTLPHVSIVIPTRDYVGVLSVCIHSLLSLTTYPAFDVVIIDNGSVRPETLHFFKNLNDPRVRVVRDDAPFNFSHLINLGARESKGELLCFLNNDIQITQHDWLHEMVSFALRPDVGAVGARLWYNNGQLQHAGVTLGIQGMAGHTHKLLARGDAGYLQRAVLHQAVSAVTAACMLVRRSVFDQVQGFDENLGVAYNDVDFCLRVRATGLHNVWTPYAEMIHHESISRGLEDNPEKLARFTHESGILKDRWGAALLNDPAYNPNLTLDHEDFSLAWPPRTR